MLSTRRVWSTRAAGSRPTTLQHAGIFGQGRLVATTGVKTGPSRSSQAGSRPLPVETWTRSPAGPGRAAPGGLWNLGIGLPTAVARGTCRGERGSCLHSGEERSWASGPFPRPDEVDADLVNAQGDDHGGARASRVRLGARFVRHDRGGGSTGAFSGRCRSPSPVIRQTWIPSRLAGQSMGGAMDLARAAKTACSCCAPTSTSMAPERGNRHMHAALTRGVVVTRGVTDLGSASGQATRSHWWRSHPRSPSDENPPWHRRKPVKESTNA